MKSEKVDTSLVATGFIYDVELNGRRLAWQAELDKCPHIDGAGEKTAGYDNTCREVVNWGTKPVCGRCGLERVDLG